MTPSEYLSREHGISIDDADLLFEVARACCGHEREPWIRADAIAPERYLSVLSLVHRELLKTDDRLGVLFLWVGDAGRNAMRAAHRATRRRRRAA